MSPYSPYILLCPSEEYRERLTDGGPFGVRIPKRPCCPTHGPYPPKVAPGWCPGCKMVDGGPPYTDFPFRSTRGHRDALILLWKGEPVVEALDRVIRTYGYGPPSVYSPTIAEETALIAEARGLGKVIRG